MNETITKEYKYNKNPYLKLHSHNYFQSNRPSKRFRVIVFDLDETLGSFQDFYILWTALQDFQKTHHPFPFNDVLDLYPEFIRTSIYPILNYVYQRKKEHKCKGIYLYTKNKNSVVWVQLICRYFQHKINSLNDFFDKIVYAFKVDNHELEINDYDCKKGRSDFIQCVMLPSTTEICFIDNTYFSEMKHAFVYYIQPSSYYHTLSSSDIIQRFIHSDMLKNWNQRQKKELHDFLQFHFLHNPSVLPAVNSVDKQIWDEKVAQKIMFHVREFFYVQKMASMTRKKRHLHVRFTRKSY